MDKFRQMLKEGRFPLVMSLPRNDPALARAAWENGADVVKIHINVKHHASQTLFGSFEEERVAIEAMLAEAKGPMGIVLGADCCAAERSLPQAVAYGFDFLSLYGHHASPTVLSAAGIIKMIAPDYTWADWEIEGLQETGADILEASVMHPDSYGQPLSGRELIRYRHLVRLSPLPIVVPTQRAVRPDEVCALRACGVSGLMIGAVVTGKDACSIGSAVAAFRKSIDEMRKRP